MNASGSFRAMLPCAGLVLASAFTVACSDPGAGPPRVGSTSKSAGELEPSDTELRERSTPMQYAATQNHETEPGGLAAPAASPPSDERRAYATFAGGCFWCMEQAFDEVEGVIRATSGFTGGQLPNPTYRQVSAGGTGHYEAVEVVYDPQKTDYGTLLEVFWHNVDPTDPGGQCCDRGDAYRTAIFARDATQRVQAEASRDAIEARRALEIVTPVLEAGPFHPAEASHQDYHEMHPVQYAYYKWSCGRQQRLEQVWGEDLPRTDRRR
ncbi:MAG: peptide-methionine (S)-S-oxide reductase MsrA [Myxococcota bacterium]